MLQKKIKIFHVLNHFLPDKYAGTEIYVNALCKYLLLNDINSSILIPNYASDTFYFYEFDGLNVCKYPETSLVDRDLILGFRNPDGLAHFTEYLKNERPSIVHFHEIAGSNGITLSHISAAKALGIKIVVTFHVVGYSCKSGSLIQSNYGLCNGVIETFKCSKCFLNTKLDSYSSFLLSTVSSFLNTCNINTLNLKSQLGTALSSAFLIDLHKKKLHFISDNADSIILLNEWYKNILLSNNVNSLKLKVVNQALPHDYDSFQTDNIQNDCLRLVYVGRISFIKGLHILVEAIMNLPKIKVELYIYGSSEDNIYDVGLKKLSSNFENIKWMGIVNPKDVIRVLSEFDALCLCSTISEMSPLVIQEAWAAGIPVIASNVYGNSAQIVNGHNGLLFDVNNSEELKDIIFKCINNKELLKGLSKNIKKPRSFSEVGSEHIHLYNSIL
jgi:glycosyltransferase involved in cell wall biosynthesis